MDDLDHSVEIAEKDWESFYEDSEECSIQQAGLAGLDDSGFSDTDDEKNYTKETILLPQAKSDQLINEGGAEPQYSEDFSNKQTAQLNLAAKSACFTDSNIRENVISLHDQMQNASQAEKLGVPIGGFNDVLDQAVGEAITSPLCIQDKVNSSSEGNMISEVMECSENPKKEKERWFVTVNYSPERLRRIRGTAKEKKKKKSSRTWVEPSKAMEKQDSLENAEEQIKERKNELNQIFSVHLNTCHNNSNEEVTSNSSTIKDVLELSEGTENLCIPKIICTSESFYENENSVVLFSCESGDTLNVHTKIPKNNSSSSLDDLYLCNHTDTQHLPTNDQHIASQPKMTIPFLTESNTLINVNDESHENCPITKFLNAAPVDIITQEPLIESQTQDKIFFLEKTPGQKAPNEDLEAAVGPMCPIYALSSFWDEMEKLTINDILHIRSAHNGSSLPQESTHTDNKNLLNIQDGSLTDDGADSGYFTIVEDSKPERSSGEVSTLSDFDEELLQMSNPSATPSPEPQNIKEQSEMFASTHVAHQELDLTTKHFDLEHLELEDGSPLYLDPDKEPQNVPLMLNLDNSQFELDSNRAVSFWQVGDTLIDQSFRKDWSFVPDELPTSSPQGSVVSFHHSQNLSMVETYDDFFSDFEVGNLFFPSVLDKTVPIFSTSRSIVNNYYKTDIEDNISLIPTITHISSELEMDSCVSETPNLCLFTSQRKNWRSLLSLRRICYAGKGSTWYHRVSSWIYPKEVTQSTAHATESQQVIPLLQVDERPQHSVLIPSKLNYKL